MITFTEHNEVIMSVSDMRNLIRLAYTRGYNDKENHPEVGGIFGCETTVRVLESEARLTGDCISL